MHSITTSIRLTPKLREELEQAAHSLHRGKNWIITQALEDYLSKLSHTELKKEARRQSLLASKVETSSEEEWWQDNADTSSWT